jgi:hypothetical protein
MPLNTVESRMAKADIRRQSTAIPDQSRSIAVHASQFGLTAVVKDALIRGCGSLKAAAITMGMDQGQLSRDLQSGALKLDRLDRLDVATKGVIVAALHDAYAPLAPSPQARVREAVRDIRRKCDEVEQYLEFIA